MSETVDNALDPLVDHLFRHESGRLTAALVRILGPGQWDVAEEIVQETLLLALSRWPLDGVPENPAAWLTRVAKRRALDALRRREVARRHEPAVAHAFQLKALEQKLDAHFSSELTDDVLRLMCSCCVPSLTVRAQLVVILKTLCGFSVDEIAAALLVKASAVERQLTRAKARIREVGLVDADDADALAERLPVVECAIYVLFNEGYHGAHRDAAIRDDLCSEALRLGGLLAEHPNTRGPKAHALMALMCLSAARLPARRDAEGALVALEDQDRSRWSAPLVRMGFEHLRASAAGGLVSSYHVEAAIAATHASASSWERTDWARIVSLYDALLGWDDTPIVRLNRAVAVLHTEGPAACLALLEHESDALSDYPFLHAARARCHAMSGETDAARSCWERALALARNPDERAYFERQATLNETSVV